MIWRIVETHPGVYVVQRKWMGLWLRRGRDYSTSLQDARYSLANARLASEWKPIIHAESSPQKGVDHE